MYVLVHLQILGTLDWRLPLPTKTLPIRTGRKIGKRRDTHCVGCRAVTVVHLYPPFAWRASRREPRAMATPAADALLYEVYLHAEHDDGDGAVRLRA